jgi:hypothetical protein
VQKIRTQEASQFIHFTPDNEAQWLALLLRIREVPGLNIDPETGYPEFLVVFLRATG